MRTPCLRTSPVASFTSNTPKRNTRCAVSPGIGSYQFSFAPEAPQRFWGLTEDASWSRPIREDQKTHYQSMISAVRLELGSFDLRCIADFNGTEDHWPRGDWMQNGLTAMFFLMASSCLAAQVSPPAESAFESYVANLEARLERQHAKPETYLAMLTPGMSEDIQVEPVNGGTWQVGGALLHHWRGAAFVPNVTPKDMLKLLRDSNHISMRYGPEVVSSRTLPDYGSTARFIVRLKEQRLLTIVLDVEYEIEARLSGSDQGYSVSRSTHVWQIDHPGTAQERRRPQGEDDGFLWHLNSYWSFARVRQGLQIECEAVSLTRDVPPGLGWLILPIIADFPREKLAFTLVATKKALTAKASQEENR